MTNKRKAISKKLRFEVLKRDSFKCQYCGAAAPDVLLHVDHIVAVKNKGAHDITNFVTSCAPCNFGKGAIPLDDNSAMAKSKKQLDELNERRLQLEMMLQWKEELLEFEGRFIAAIQNLFTPFKYKMTQSVIGEVKNLIRKHGFDEFYESLSISLDTYGLQVYDGIAQSWSLNKVLKKAAAIAYVRKSKREDPEWNRYYYIRGILRRRFPGFDEKQAYYEIRKNYEYGLPMEQIEYAAKRVESFAQLVEFMPLIKQEIDKNGQN